MEKDDWLQPQVLQTRISPEMFYSSDLAWTWWKMNDLHPGTADQTHLNIYLYSSPEMVKDDWTYTHGTADQSLT